MTLPGLEQETRPPAAGKTSMRIAAAVGAALLLGLAVLIGVRVKQATAKGAALKAERAKAQASATLRPPVAVTHAVATTWRPRVEITGTIKPWRSADIGFEQGGRLARILVSVGDDVKDGQPLAYLDTSIAGAQVNQAEAQTKAAEANLALAEDNMKRTQALAASKSIPEAQAVQAEQQVALARAQLDGARAAERLARTGAGQRSIAAPFAGLVTKAPTAAGGVVAPGVALVHLEDHSRFRLSATVGEEVADLVKPGETAKIAYRDRWITGRVSVVVPSLDQATRRAPIEIEVPNDPKDPLLAWSFVRATIDGEKDVPALRIPGTARRPGSQDELVVVQGGKAHFVHVTGSVAPDGSWIVRDGITPADLVVVSPEADLREGDAVTKTEVK